MRRALLEARKNLRSTDGGPFGACIVRRDHVVAAARNTVLKNDATAHAEINVIRKACKLLSTFDLSDCVIYSTTEPCPMCFSAIHWARIPELVFGTAIADVRARGFHELSISNEQMKKLGKSSIQITPAYLQADCRALLSDWDRLPGKTVY